MDFAVRAPAWPMARTLAVRMSPLVTAATIALALLIRGRRVFTLVDFPLNDGGMFAVAIDDIRRAGYALPSLLTYNLEGIPFAYPPLAFYVSLAVQDLFGLSTTDVLRVLPVVFATLIVVAYVPLARALAPNAVVAAIAVYVVAVQPSAFTWMVMGGGLTRALGIAFAVAGLYTLHRWLTRGGRIPFVATAVFAALALLSHLEMAWFFSFSAALFVFFYARDRRRAFAALAGAAALAGILTAPWWLTVVSRWGVMPFLYAARTGSLSDPIYDLVWFQRTDEPFFPVIAALGILGAVVSVLRGRYAIPAWLVATALLDSRSFNVLSSLQLGLLCGVALTEVIVPFARSRRPIIVAGAILLVYTAIAGLKADQDLHRALTPPERASMTWVADNTPPDARFIVITQRFWAGDRAAEWFPALAQRHSVDTVQGTEWLAPPHGFWYAMDAYEQAQECGDRDAGCLLGWANAYAPFDYVFIPKTLGGYDSDGSAAYCCNALRFSLASDPAFKVVYDGPGGSVYQLVRR